MKALLALSTVACALTSAGPVVHKHHVSPTMKTKIEQSDKAENVQLFTQEKDHPNVKLSGYLYEINFDSSTAGNADGRQIGIAINIMADLFAQIKSPAFWVERNNENWMVVNPHIFGEISAETEFTLKLWLLDVTMSAKIMGYKFAPIDYQMAWDLNNKERYCYSCLLYTSPSPRDRG